MTLPRWFAWVILVLAFFTAGLLRQYHEHTPASPYVSPVVGSLLFAVVFLLLLVAGRERRLGVMREHGVRIGSLTPILLMLMVEKWLSVTFYNPGYFALWPDSAPEAWTDARYRAFAGVALIAICVLAGAFSPPAGHRTWRRARPARWPMAAAGTVVVVVGTYGLLWGFAALLGGGLRFDEPVRDRLWIWIVGGQTLRAFAEEVYYRGLLLAEMERLAPRLGVHSPAGRRWTALVPTASLFAMEHLTLAPPWGQTLRQLAFTLSLGLLLGILVMVTTNLFFAAGVHAYINWMLLAAAPRLVDGSGEPALSPGTYIGLALALAFVLAFVRQQRAAARR